jgi:hypothetical protein
MVLVHDAQGRPLTVSQDDLRLLFQPVERREDPEPAITILTPKLDTQGEGIHGEER